MERSIRDIAAQLGVLTNKSDLIVDHISIDSRTISNGGSTLFIAIKGERHDGHEYVPELYNKGVRAFVVEQPVVGDFPSANFLRVDDTVIALQLVAAFHRKDYDLPVVGITGSYAKTIIKEWLYNVLSKNRVVTRSPKSFNSQVGVPLSVLQLNKQSEVGVFEAGISQLGEMDKLESIIKPTIGLITNLGAAHDHGFTSRKEK